VRGGGWGGRRHRRHPHTFPPDPRFPGPYTLPPPLPLPPPPKARSRVVDRSPSPPPKRPKLEEVAEVEGAFEPSPLTFKAFLATQEEEVEEEAALASYRDYTKDFKQRTLQRFFETHCGEEWLRQAYHPVVAARVAEEQREAVGRRSRVYWRAKEQLRGASLQVEQADHLVDLMDTFVELLEEEETKETKEPKEEENNNEVAEEKPEEPLATVEESSEPPPKAEPVLKPKSVYLRRLLPSVTLAQLAELGGAFPGFLRVAAGAPRPTDAWRRGAWLTFAPATDVRAVCLALAGRRLGTEELEVAVNRPLGRRVLPAPPLAGHPAVVARDLRLASRLVARLDAKMGIDSGELLEGVDELLAEEKVELEEAVEGEMVAVLDRLLVYLRAVHSVDWYAGAQYSENRMPSRLGLVHARQALPQGVAEEELKEHLDTSQARLDELVADKQVLSEEQVQELGGKQEQVEVDRFVEANVEQKSKEKWLVRLSGKKFKGFEFARKHILARFPEHVAEVRHDVRFFNSFLADPSRPRLPDRPKKPKKETEPEVEVAAAVPPRARACGARAPPAAGPGPWDRRGWGQGGRAVTRVEARRPIDYSDIEDMLDHAHVHAPCPW